MTLDEAVAEVPIPPEQRKWTAARSLIDGKRGPHDTHGIGYGSNAKRGQPAMNGSRERSIIR